MTDHDRLFKELLTTFFIEFIELFAPQVLNYLDQTSLVAMDKEIFTDVTSGESHEVDIVMRANFKGQNTFFLIHVENQSKSQPEFPWRMFQYFARLHEKYTYPVYPIALLTFDRPLRAEPETYRVEFPDKKILEFNFTAIQLNRLNWRNYLNRPNPVASALMAKMKIAPKDRVKVKLECLRMLVGLGLNPARRRLISGFVGTYLQLDDHEEVEFQSGLETILPDQKEAVMEIMTDWTIRGIEKGRQEGKQEGELNLVLRLLQRRIGTIPPELEQQVSQLPLTEIEELGEALLDFSNRIDLENWLQTHTTQAS